VKSDLDLIDARNEICWIKERFISLTFWFIHGCHLVLFKPCARNKMIRPFGHFWALIFWLLKRVVNFNACFGEIWAKLAMFYEKHNLQHLWNSNFKLFYSIFFLKKICPLFILFSFLRIWPFWNWLWANLAFFGLGIH